MSRKSRRKRQHTAQGTREQGQGAGGMRKVTTPDKAGDIPVSPYNTLSIHIPEGVIDEWSDEEWDAFSYGLEGLSDEDQDRVWAVLQEREDYAAMGVEIKQWEEEGIIGDVAFEQPPKSIASMTDAEWTEWQLQEFGEIDSAVTKPIGILSDYSKPKTALQEAKSKAGAVCTCDGPGSLTEKFKSHIMSCAAYVAPTWVTPQTYKRSCSHDRDTVKLEDGLSIFASGKFDVKSVDGDDRVDLGIYLDRGWQGYDSPSSTLGVWFPWMEDVYAYHHPAVYLNWPDRKRPSTPPETMVEMAYWVFEQLSGGVHIEVGCLGGHGRTGTILACLLGVQSKDNNPYNAVNKLWAEYCVNAVEDASQMSYIAEVYELVHGSEWRQSKKMQDTYSKWMHEYFTPVATTYGKYQGKGAAPQKISPVTSMFSDGWQGAY